MTDWQERFLQALRASRTAYDQPPDWRAALALYEPLPPAEQGALDQIVLGMISEEYRNPHSSRDQLPFDDVMVNLPAGMVPDDLVCVEAAVLVAAQRELGAGLFHFNRLMRSPRWHALYPRLYWLNYEGFAAQRRLAGTLAGRHLGAMLGLALGEGLVFGSEAPATMEWGPVTEQALALAQHQPREGLASVLTPECRRPLTQLLGGSGRPDPDPAIPVLTVVATTGSLEECLTQAVNLSIEDRAACGTLAGALYGPLAAPRRWSTALRERERLEGAAEAFFHASAITS